MAVIGHCLFKITKQAYDTFVAVFSHCGYQPLFAFRLLVVIKHIFFFASLFLHPRAPLLPASPISLWAFFCNCCRLQLCSSLLCSFLVRYRYCFLFLFIWLFSSPSRPVSGLSFLLHHSPALHFSVVVFHCVCVCKTYAVFLWAVGDVASCGYLPFFFFFFGTDPWRLHLSILSNKMFPRAIILADFSVLRTGVRQGHIVLTSENTKLS